MKLNWQNTAIFIGLLGGLLSIPKSAIDGWHAILRRPHVQVDPYQKVSLTYNQKLKNLVCSAGFVVQNTGDMSELIYPSGAHLGGPTDPSRTVHFSGTDIILKDGEHEADTVLAQQSIPKILTFEITVPVSDSIRGLFTQHETPDEFVVELAGKHGSRPPYKATFHLKLTELVLKQLLEDGYVDFPDSDK